ncbi:phosphoglycerate kinase [Candidatus Dependentiae bacterium]|nr:phosphoglycerate kinase [Candidatus Dependentiae bacterium]
MNSTLPTSTFTSWPLKNQTVFLRADLNVPLINGTIASDFRLQALLPTLNILVTKGSKIILATHIGRPQAKDLALSTRILIPWFQEHGYSVTFASTLEQANILIKQVPSGTLVLLENLRFWPEEQSPSFEFASVLKHLADYYINDAFGVAHRTDTSVTVLAELYAPDHKSIGLLMQKELEALSYLKEQPSQPFLFLVGGGKIKDKLPLMQALLPKIATVALCPALVFTFLKALGKPVGRSLVDDTLIDQARQILQQAHKNNVSVLFPEDYLVTRQQKLEPPYEVISAENFDSTMTGISIGPKTVELYKQAITKAHTIFLTGACCITEQPISCTFFNDLLQAIAQASAYSVIGGGDSVSAVYKQGLEHTINFCSTGGGATLTYLSSQQLPALKSMLE